MVRYDTNSILIEIADSFRATILPGFVRKTAQYAPFSHGLRDTLGCLKNEDGGTIGQPTLQLLYEAAFLLCVANFSH